jgi:EmrB/QacA subfamily drug resistance transporter
MTKWRTLIAVSIAAFMLLLDVTVVNVALPEIRTDLNASFNELRWVIDAYALTLASTILIFGTLCDRFGRRRVFVIGLAIFSFASLACALAWTPTSLILFRGVQGLGGAAMLSTSLALIASAYEGRDRANALAVWGATIAAAVAIGPLVGGALVEVANWESIFLVNVPVGLVTAVLVARGVPESRDPTATGRIDWGGLVTLTAGLTLLVLALFEGNDEGWGSTRILVFLGVAVVLLIGFVLIERRAEQPMLDLSLFRKPTTAGASISVLFIAISVFAMLTFLVFYIQNTLGYSPLETGVRLFPLTIASFFAAAISGRLTEKVQLRFLIAAGLAMAAAGSILNSNVEVGSDWTALLAGGILIGLGAGTVNPAIAAAALGAAPPRQSGMASGLNSAFRLLGVAVGVAGLGAILESRVSDELAERLSTVPAGLADVVATGDVQAAAQGAPPGMQDTVRDAAEAAFVSGFDLILIVATVVAVVGAVAALLLVRQGDIAQSH